MLLHSKDPAMPRWTLLLSLCVGFLVALPLPSQEKKADDKPYGIDKRTPWTTSKVAGSPEPPPPYTTEVAFPKIKLSEPLEIVTAPGSERFFVVQHRGKIFSFPNDPKADKAELFLDVGKVAYSMTFHPKFATNGYCYVTYVLDADKQLPKGTRVARFQVKKDNPLQADPKSEKIIFEWPSGGHNAGCLRFGPDGYLYIGTGDGSGIADELQTGQDISDHLSSILRIDVDNPEEGKTYRVPKDNPFVKTEGAKPEIWAYGVRQPWKMSFDSKTGALWVGEVGQDLWESVLKIEKGGNYGWSVMEGTHPFRPERKLGPTPILKPIAEHPHTDFRSLTGGYIYHGKRIKELTGAYIYGDFDTGKVWMLRHDGKKLTENRELAQTRIRLVGFSEGHDGELFLLDYMGGQVHRLVANPHKSDPDAFPRKLSETGLFSSTKDLKPAPGLIPYSVNAQLWSDGAHKERFLAMPGDAKIEFETITYPQPSPGSRAGWRFSDGTVAVKTFFLELEKGNPASRRRLETRLLHLRTLAGTEEVGDQYWSGYTYVWNDAQTDAELLETKGLDRDYTIKDRQAPGGTRKQTWHFPSRAECTLCHTVPAKYVLGINTVQLNKDHDYGGVTDNQLRTWDHLGLFKKPLPTPPAKLPRLVDFEDAKNDINLRARSYLHANCSHCHIKWGGGNAEFQLIATMDLKDLGIVNTRANHGTFKIEDGRVLVPGAPERSLMLHRMTLRGLGQMPHIASNVVDETGVKLVREWIKQLPK
jgi:uncharacterized repeat protein (TIGR03806 family)